MLLEVAGDVPPPYMPLGVPGFFTVTAAIPLAATSASGTVAVIWVALTKVVVRAVPFQLMVALPLKFAPVPISPFVPIEIPVVVLLGTRETMFGMFPAAAGMLDFEL